MLIAASANDIRDLGWSVLELGGARLPLRTQSRLRVVDRQGRMQLPRGTVWAAAVGPGHGEVAKECIRSHPNCLDPSEVLPRDSFHLNDGHWNRGGHQIIARHVRRWLLAALELRLLSLRDDDR